MSILDQLSLIEPDTRTPDHTAPNPEDPMSNVTTLNLNHTPEVATQPAEPEDSIRMEAFEHEVFGTVRVVYGLTDDGSQLFVGQDGAGALGYARPRDALLTHCDDATRLKELGASFGDPRWQQILSELHIHTKLITEADLYALIFGSKLPGAKRFKQWVTKEVIPSIRKTGTYSVYQSTPHTIPQTLADALQLGADQAREIEALTAKSIQQAGIIETHLEYQTAAAWVSNNLANKSECRTSTLGTKATRILRERGLEKEYIESRYWDNKAKEYVTGQIGVYPHDALEEAAKEMGFYPTRGYTANRRALQVV